MVLLEREYLWKKKQRIDGIKGLRKGNLDGDDFFGASFNRIGY